MLKFNKPHKSLFIRKRLKYQRLGSIRRCRICYQSFFCPLIIAVVPATMVDTLKLIFAKRKWTCLHRHLTYKSLFWKTPVDNAGFPFSKIMWFGVNVPDYQDHLKSLWSDGHSIWLLPYTREHSILSSTQRQVKVTLLSILPHVR